MKGKKGKNKKRVLVVTGTVVGLLALFLIIVFIPVGDTTKTVTVENTVEEVQQEDVDGMSRAQLEKRVEELEAENKELKEEVETYKILAEKNTQVDMIMPKVTVDDDSDSDDKTETSSKDKKTDKTSDKKTDKTSDKTTSDKTGSDKSTDGAVDAPADKDVEYKDSSEYFDKDYTKYTEDEDSSDSSTDSDIYSSNGL